MNDRKLSPRDLDAGPFEEQLSRQLYRGKFSPEATQRIKGALQTALEAMAQKFNLSLGIGGNHIDDVLHFIDKNYKDDERSSHYLKKKECAFLEEQLREWYGARAEVLEEND